VHKRWSGGRVDCDGPPRIRADWGLAGGWLDITCAMREPDPTAGPIKVECRHRDCHEEAAADTAFCALHLEGLRFLFAQLEIRCPTCGAWASEGLLWHDCSNPGPQPPAEEI
jgi:hypothetical protein